MTISRSSLKVRRKAVWGLERFKRQIASATLLAFGLNYTVVIAGPRRPGPVVRHSQPASIAQLVDPAPMAQRSGPAPKAKDSRSARRGKLSHPTLEALQSRPKPKAEYSAPEQKVHSDPAPKVRQNQRGRRDADGRGARNSNVKKYKLDRELTFRADHHNSENTTRVIVELQPGAELPAEFKKLLKRRGRLSIINGRVIEVPNRLLKKLAALPSVFSVHYDREATRSNYRTSVTVGARAAQAIYGYNGGGVGIAVIDSGIATWHDDLISRSSTSYPWGNQRVAGFVDFVNGQSTPYDDDGHSTHVSGIITGNGYDSYSQKAGIAPAANVVALKVLDANGAGTISNIIAALDWVLTNHATYNIRVVNLSVGASINESYWTDPLTLAAKRVVDAGVVVVAAAGNVGQNDAGEVQHGGINAPGNAPWVLTVGASSTEGTTQRVDDEMTSFSSRGPTYLDWAAKPDLVAPGAGTVSMADPSSMLASAKSQYLLAGTRPTASLPYLTLSGASMAAPVVSGAVALMLQANPNLTPNAVKAILTVHRRGISGIRHADPGRRLPQLIRSRAARALLRDGAAGRLISASDQLEQEGYLGQPVAHGRCAGA